MEKINFSEILSQSWKITWSHKKLWWFGLLAGGSNWMPSLNSFDNTESEAMPTEKIADFFFNHVPLLILGASVIILILILLGIFGILAYSGLINSVQKIASEKETTFWTEIKHGRKFFWRILGTKTLFAFSSLLLLLVLTAPIVFLFSVENYALGTITTLLAILIFFPVIITFSFIETFGNLYILTSDLSLRSAVEQGYFVFKQNLKNSLLLSIILLAIGALIGIILLVLIFVISLPLIILGIILAPTTFPFGAWLVGTFSVLLIVLATLAVRSIWNTFLHTAWLLFFRIIATSKKETLEVVKEEILTESVIRPEEA